jgi:hypothetical protein
MNWSKVGQQGSAVQIRDRKSQSTEGMTMRGAVLYGPRDVRFGHLLGAGPNNQLPREITDCRGGGHSLWS